MSARLLRKVLRHPLLLLRNVLWKCFIGPVLYGKGDGYDAPRYWKDRLDRHGFSLRGPGDEGLTEQENEAEYQQFAAKLVEICEDLGVDFRRARVLDIGVGTGYYTEIMHRRRVQSYVGVDITDTLFAALERRYPEYEFRRQDVTAKPIAGEYDVILLIDAVQHITEESKLGKALQNAAGCLSQHGTLFISGVYRASKKRLFYVRHWSPADIMDKLKEFSVDGPIPYRDNNLLIVSRAELGDA